MENSQKLVKELCMLRFPDYRDPMYEVYLRTGALEMPPSLGVIGRSARLTPESLAKRKERWEEIRAYEMLLQSKSSSELLAVKENEQNIERLCELLEPDYSAVKPSRLKAMSAMSVPGADGNISAGTEPSSRGRVIYQEEQTEILRRVSRLKDVLRTKEPDDVKTQIDDVLAKQWRDAKCTIGEAANEIARKIHPGDEYPWMTVDREKCEKAYLAHIKEAILLGRVPFYNPHRKTKFDISHLSEDRFPEDGLIDKADLHLCLMHIDEGKGYLPLPSKPISKAPPPIAPLNPSSSWSPPAKGMQTAQEAQVQVDVARPLTKPLEVPTASVELTPGKSARKAPDKFVRALNRLLVEIAQRAERKKRLFSTAKMPGTRQDLLALASKFDVELDKPITTFETYIKGFCSFKAGTGYKQETFYRDLFPEYF